MNSKQKDIRWEQRFSNYQKAIKKLSSAVEVVQEDTEGFLPIEKQRQEILKEGLIQRFEYTHQLAWNVMKDYAEYQGNSEIQGSRDATREAFKMGLIANPESWMDMIKSRNETSHTYNEETAEEIIQKIITIYHPLFLDFLTKMYSLKTRENMGLFDREL